MKKKKSRKELSVVIAFVLILAMILPFVQKTEVYADQVTDAEGQIFEIVTEGEPEEYSVPEKIGEEEQIPEEYPVSEATASEPQIAEENTEAMEPVEESDATDDSYVQEEVGEEPPDIFRKEKELDGVLIKIEAEEGTFPVDAELKAEAADIKAEKEAEEAVDEVRPAHLNVADSYTFDIKVVDKDGNELQPSSGKKVKVSFETDHAKDQNLEATIYHIAEVEKKDLKTKKAEVVFEAEKLDSDMDIKESTVSAETEGFSLYTVEFTYGDLTYVHNNTDNNTDTVSLETIAEKTGLTGTAFSASADTADADYLTIDNTAKTVTFLKTFTDAKVLTVTLNSGTAESPILTAYDINVKNCVFSKTAESWENLQKVIEDAEDGDIIVLNNDLDCTNNKSIKVDGDDVKNVTIDLAGHRMDRKRSSDTGDGHVINVKDGAALTLIDSVGGGTLTGGNATDGGGIKIEKDSTCIVENVNITGNKASKDGAGIYVWGTLKMTGGTISNNEAKDNGGGIYVENTGTLDLDGVTISGNTSKNGGGGLKIFLKSDGAIKNCIISGNKSKESDGAGLLLDAKEKTLTITDTTISDNTAGDEGGGIFVEEGRIVMNGGAITNNTSNGDGGSAYNESGTIQFKEVVISENYAVERGGAVFNRGIANLTDCIFNSNKAVRGGAIFSSQEKMELVNPAMTKNIAQTEGGAIYVGDAELTIDGGSITENKALKGGSGIFLQSNSDSNNLDPTETLKVKGCLVVENNQKDNVYIEGFQFINIDSSILYFPMRINVVGALGDGDNKAQIGVTLGKDINKGKQKFTNGFKNYNPEEEPSDYFFADQAGYSVVADDAGEGILKEGEWTTLQQLIEKTDEEDNGNGEAPVLTLGKDFTAKEDDEVLTIPEGKRISIDLNGYTINRNRDKSSDDGQVFKVLSGASLTIKDSSDESTGTVKGGCAVDGGAINLQSGAKCTIEGGNISGNKAQKGAAVFVSGGSELNVKGGHISGNSSANGGAIYLAEGSSVVNISGGQISGNRASDEGGGVWVGAGKLNISGTPNVTGNTASTGKNIFLGAGNLLHIEDTLEDGAKLDISGKNASTEGVGAKFTDGLTETTPFGSTPEEYARGIFTYEDQSFDKFLEIKEGEIYRISVTEVDVWVSDWASLQAAIKNENNKDKVIGLSNDITAASGDDRQLHNNKWTVTIELNGNKLDRNRSENDSDGHVFEIQNGATLVIKDSVGTGLITGGYADHGGGIHVGNDSFCRIESGTIGGNKADVDGGGIYVRGTLTMTGGRITENSADDTAGGIYCTDTGTFDLKNVTIENNVANNDGGGLIVHLKNDAKIEDCRIINNKSKTEDGGALRMEADNKTLRIINTEISGNWAENDGGAIVIYDGSVLMNGGSISGNTSEVGGGVFNGGGTIDFTDVIISGNKASKNGGGIYNDNKAELTKCTIRDNYGKDNGGGIFADDDMTISSCTIEKNKTDGDGGGIYTNNTDVTIKDSSRILSNTSGKSGGGIHIKDGDVNISNTEITGNTAFDSGGGIYVNNDAKLNLSAVITITGNKGQVAGGGILIGDSVNTVAIKDKIVIKDNSALAGPNVLLRATSEEIIDTSSYNGWTFNTITTTEIKHPIKLSGPLSEGSIIGVSLDCEIEDVSDKITKDYEIQHPGTDPRVFFTPDNGYSIQKKEGEAVIYASEWNDLQVLIDEAEDGSTLLLDRSWKAITTDAPLTISAGKTLTIDLNGYTLNRNCTSVDAKDGGEVFDVLGSLTIKDSSKSKKGQITGGNGIKGGGIYVESGAVFELQSGTISGNTASNGGGIYNEGTLNINADGITENKAANGGGIYNAAGGTVNLTATVSGNISEDKAGGIFVSEGSMLNVSGDASVKDNIGVAGRNILLEGTDTAVNFTGVLSETAYIDVMAYGIDPKNDKRLTSGWDIYKGSGVFAYDGKTYDGTDETDRLKNINGELYLKGLSLEDVIWVSSWKDLSNKLKSKDYNNKVIALSCDISPSSGDSSNPLQVLGNKKLDLCGHKLDSKRTYFSETVPMVTTVVSGAVITVGGLFGGGTEDDELEIRDSAGSGMITGGCESGIVVQKFTRCIISDGTITGNKAGRDGNGGGIYVEGSLTMTGGAVIGNTSGDEYSSSDKGLGGGIYSTGSVNLENVIIADNAAQHNGGGLYLVCTKDMIGEPSGGDNRIANCRITENITLEGHGGGLYVAIDENKLDITDTVISKNTAVHEDDYPVGDGILPPEDVIKGNNGGGIYLASGTVNMGSGSENLPGGAIKNNTAENGGGVFVEDGNINIDGTEISGNTAVTQDLIYKNEELHLGGDGAGIYNKNNIKLINSTISSNKAEKNGGGIWTNDKATIENCIVTSNYADAIGGGIYYDSGDLNIIGSSETRFQKNEAGQEGAGIMACKDLHVQKKILIDDCVYLASGKKLVIDDALSEGSNINVALDDTWGIFTNGFKAYHSDANPSDWFTSDLGYSVLKTADGEAELKLVLDDGSRFIDFYNRINDTSKLTKANWMSGISGDRYINEINLPCTHDSAMKVVLSHTFSSIGSFFNYSGNAQTQVRYIDEQMNDGIRRLDIRLNNRYEASKALGLWISFEDDGENLWLCHGKTWAGGTFWAANHKGDDLSFSEVLDWVKDFLRKHPTEMIILDLQPEPVNSWGHDVDDDTETINGRAWKMVQEFSKEINPSTGKPYVYWEDGKVCENMTRYPQLKEVRGQVIFAGDCNVGGINSWSSLGISDEPDGSHGESTQDKIKHTYEFYNKSNKEKLTYIPKDVTERIERDGKSLIYRASVLTAPLGVGGLPKDTPLNAADKIHEALYYSDHEDTGVFNQRGQYVGYLRQDGATAKLNRFVWISNFPEDDPDTAENEGLNYCTVHVNSNIDPASVTDPKKVEPQVYKLLKGTEFMIPGNIYGYEKELQSWDATVPSGSDTESGALVPYHQGDTYKLMGDVTFTANFTYKFEVKYEVEGGSFEEGTSTTETVYDGASPKSVPAGDKISPDKTHKETGAWYKGDTKLTGTPADETVTEATTFTYKFDEKDKFDVKYTVEGGSVEGGTPTTETVYDGAKPASVPAGDKITPDETHKETGAWYKGDTKLTGTPADETVTEATTFTYKFDEKDKFDVKYTVEGGSFEEGTSTTETVYDGAKPASVPAEDKISPDETHKETGAWYKEYTKLTGTPADETITEATTFTYKFDEKDKFEVKYAVEGGSFEEGTPTTETVYDGASPKSVPAGDKIGPDGTHKETGAWYKGETKLTGTPADETITEATTFTYKFDDKDKFEVKYEVEGGSFEEGTPTTETVYDGAKPASVPAGEKITPDETHKGTGAWYKGDTKLTGTPADETITEATTFTYKFDEKNKFEVKYEVVGGSFEEGTPTTETVYDGAKPASVPAEEKITPDETHKDTGAWYKGDTKLTGTPADETITEATTFTYKFDEKDKFDVKYTVEGGSFEERTPTTETVYDGASPKSVPAVDKITPDETHKGTGAWYKGDTKLTGTPADETVTEATTFTYKFDEKDNFDVKYTLEGGSFKEGTPTTETVYDGAKPASVPAEEKITPDETHKGTGAWYKGDTKLTGTPADETITEATTFTYKFDEKDKFAVKYEVEGGSVEGGTPTTETVYDGAKPASVPAGDKISPDETHKETGAWYKGDTKLEGTPEEETISGPTTFIYKFDEKDKFDVKYTVEGGSFEEGTPTTETVYDGASPESVPAGDKISPDETHKETGAWFKEDTKLTGTPADETITEATTFTYKFDEKDKFDVKYTVEGGSFEEGTPTTETVYDGASPESVPAGDKIRPDGTHKETGAWYKGDTKLTGTPADETITEATTFTYKFDEKDKFDVKYTVEGGSFKEGTPTTETVYDGAKPASVPAEEKITPDETHKDTGAWYNGDIKLEGTPADETITEATTFTYKFDEKNKFEVKYEVVGGSFEEGTPTTETVYDGAKPASVPAEDKITPDETHKGTGAWYNGGTKLEGTPADETIIGPTTFTYKFDEKDKFDVKYAVEGGSFEEGTPTTETVYDGASPKSVPAEDKITPDETHKGIGAWYNGNTKLDGTPADETITGSATFIYKFDEKDKFEVKYELEGGSFEEGTPTTETVYDGASPKSVPSGDEMTPDEAHDNTGTWYKGETKLTGTPADETVTEATTFTYKFDEKDKLEVKYEVEGGSFEEGTSTTETVYDGASPKSVPAEDKITPDETHKETGFWYKGDTKLTGTPADEIITEATTFTYKFDEKEEFTVIFKDEDGTELKKVEKLALGDKVEEFKPTKENFVFIEWTPEFRNTVKAEDSDKNGVITYTATWKDDKNNNGTSDDEEGDVPISYKDADKDDDKEGNPDEVTETVPVGTKIIVDPNGVILNGSVEKQTIIVGTEGLILTDPTRDGYAFAGWRKTAGEGDITYIFTAEWRENAPEETAITYKDADKDDDKEGNPDEVTETVTVGTKIIVDPNGVIWNGSVEKQTITVGTEGLILTDPTREGYTFAGWRKTAGEGDITYIFTAEWRENAPEETAITYKDADKDDDKDGNPDEVTETVTVGTKIIVDPNGGIWNGSVKKQTITVGTEGLILTDPTREGYTFAGWRKTAGEGDITYVFTAQWTKNKEENREHIHTDGQNDGKKTDNTPGNSINYNANPVTGDNNNLWCYIMLLIGSTTIMAVVIRKRLAKKSKNGKIK